MGIADTYDPELNENAGFLPSLDDDFDPRKAPFPHQVNPIGGNGKRLLHLIYWLTYTQKGRQFLRERYPSKEVPLPDGRLTEEDAAAQLRAKFLEDFNLNDETVMNACIQLHFQATYWVDENKKFIAAGDAAAKAAAKAQRDIHESNYNMYLSVITWQLWLDGTGHEFSLGW